ncbi:MBOAT family O-acyltransferase [Pseudomonas putida]|uniref:MBOAT family O-acyltransferase n=1 Tax=Pseudomonas putida TaxID=303 RepID=UPI000FFC0697
MDGGYTVRIEYDWILEPHYRLAQGLPSSLPPASLTKRSQLLIPWRFFRLWSLLDGLDPPENMVRCMANNYSTLGFWRAWHRSYNLWVVRSVPLSPFSPLALPFIVYLFIFVFRASKIYSLSNCPVYDTIIAYSPPAAH